MEWRFWWNGCRPSRHMCLGVVWLVYLLLTSPRYCLAGTEEYTLAGENCNKYLRGKEAVAIKGSGGKRYSPGDVCDMTVSTTNDARWMLYVQTAFILDCKVQITIYDTPIATVSLQPVLKLSCASQVPGVIRLNTTVVVVRLLHKNASDFNFNLLLTARYVSPDRKCPWFQCDGGDCIPKSLMCDGISNCYDKSDESKNGTAHCHDYWPFKGENWGVLASVLGAAVVLGVGAACCRHLRKRRDSFDDLYDLNEGPYVHKYAYQYRVIRHPTNGNNTSTTSNSSHHHSHSHSNSSHHSNHLNSKRPQDRDKDRAVRGKLLT